MNPHWCDYSLIAADGRAAPVVDAYRRALRLQPGDSEAGKRRIWVSSDAAFYPERDEPVCLLDKFEDKEALFCHFIKISAILVGQLEKSGCVLLHAGLAELGGKGVILAAPGGTGKSTACARLPHPWRALADDATLVARTPQGGFRAHPWPTWSRFLDDGPGGSWDTSHGVDLTAAFFLRQAEADACAAIGQGKAAGMLMESAQQLCHVLERGQGPEQVRGMKLGRFAFVSGLAKRVPAHILDISLHGRFWELVENRLACL